MNKKAVKDALKLIEEARWDDEFFAWLEQNRDMLNFQYDRYRENAYENPEEPDSFENWALWQFVNEKGATE